MLWLKVTLSSLLGFPLPHGSGSLWRFHPLTRDTSGEGEREAPGEAEGAGSGRSHFYRNPMRMDFPEARARQPLQKPHACRWRPVRTWKRLLQLGHAEGTMTSRNDSGQKPAVDGQRQGPGLGSGGSKSHNCSLEKPA